MINDYIKKHSLLAAIIATPIILILIVLVMRLVAVSMPGHQGKAAYNHRTVPVSYVQQPEAGHHNAYGRTADMPSMYRITDRLVVSEAEVAVYVEDVNKSAADVSTIARAVGGYVEYADISDGERGIVIIRVPVDRFDEAIGHIKSRATHVSREVVSSRDVTMLYADLSTRLNQLQESEAYYYRLLDNGGSLQEKLQIRHSLDGLRVELDRMQAQVELLQDQEALTTIRVHMAKQPVTMGAAGSFLVDAEKMGQVIAYDMKSYLSTMLHLVMRLPVLLAWLLTGVIMALLLVKAGRFCEARYSQIFGTDKKKKK